jgi:hypothetical protein
LISIGFEYLVTVVLTEGDFLTGADAVLADLVAEVRLRVAIKVFK